MKLPPQFIDDLVGGDDTGCLKPMACPLDKGLDRLHDGARDALMVGDMMVDVEAGRTAGVHTCAVAYGIGILEDLKAVGPDFIIGDIREFKDIIYP